MAYLFNIGALKVAWESIFGTKSGDSFDFVETIGRPSFDLRREAFEDDALRQALTGPSPIIVGHRSDSTFSFSMYMHGYTSSTVSDAPDLATDLHPDAALVGAALGNLYAGGYSTISGGTSTVSNLVVADASSFVDGQAVQVGSEVTKVLEVTTDASEELSLEIPLSTAPTDGTKVCGTINAFPIDGHDATYAKPASFEWLGAASDDKIAILGSRTNSLKLTAEAKGFLTAEFGQNVVDWDREASGGTPSGLSYDFPSKAEWVAGKMVIYNITTDTRTEINCSKAELDTALALAGITDPNWDDGIAEWQKTGLRPVLTVDPYQSTETAAAGWGYSYSQGHKFAVVVQVGTTAGRVVSEILPYCQLIAEPGETEREGFVARTLTFGTLQNTRNSDQTGDTYTADDPADKELLVVWS